MATVTNFQLSLNGATWVDVNSNFTVNSLPDRVPDGLAVENSIYNILNCPIGSRGRIFQPTYGSIWWPFLQEPINNFTSTKIQMATIDALITWEPRIQIDTSNSSVTPDYTLPGYNIVIAFIVLLTSSQGTVSFDLQP